MCEIKCYILQKRALTLPMVLKCTLMCVHLYQCTFIIYVCIPLLSCTFISAFKDQNVKNALYVFVTYL